MDDEAAVRMAAIIGTVIVAAILGLVFGLGVLRDSVPQHEDAAQVTMVKSGMAVCQTLREPDRAACALGILNVQLNEQLSSYCNDLTTNSAEQVCIDNLAKGTSASAAVEAYAVCDKIAGDDKALVQCVNEVGQHYPASKKPEGKKRDGR